MKAKQHRRYDNTPSFLEEPKPTRKHEDMVKITFDGGTPCNIPSRGYGIGYGSYQIDSLPVVRCAHKKPMSANAAEIFTLVEAVRDVIRMRGRSGHLLITGDSQIALKWAQGKTRFGRPANLSKGTSQEFRDAIQTLRDVLAGFTVETQWQARRHSVALFGH